MINTTQSNEIGRNNYYSRMAGRPHKKPTQVALLREDIQEEQLLGKRVYDTRPPTPEAAFTPAGKELLRLVEESRLLRLGQTAVTEGVSDK